MTGRGRTLLRRGEDGARRAPGRRFRPWLAAALAAVALPAVAWLAGPVGAQTGKPEPDCAGLAATDPAGDSKDMAGRPGAANLDVTGLFFRSEGKTTANMRLANLTKDLPPGASAIRWYIVFGPATARRWVRGTIVSGSPDPAFSYGTYGGSPPSYTVDGDTTGKLHEGPEGIVEIVVPATVGGGAGKTLVEPIAETASAVTTPVRGQLFGADRAPDTGAGKDYLVGQCSSGQPPPIDPGVVTGPPPQTGDPARLPDTVAQRGDLHVKPASKVRLTKKASRRRRLALAVTATETVTRIRATLFAGSRVKGKAIGKGSLARVARKGKLTLKLSRPLKRGKYTLFLSGTNADGRAASRTTTIQVSVSKR